MPKTSDMHSFSKNFELLSPAERKAVIDAIMPFMNPANKQTPEDEVLEIEITVSEAVA